MNHTPENHAWAKLSSSPLMREPQMAFMCATDVPLALVSASDIAPDSVALCVKGCLGEPSGQFCQQRLLQAEKRAVNRVGSVPYCCPSGLIKILVPAFGGFNN